MHLRLSSIIAATLLCATFTASAGHHDTGDDGDGAPVAHGNSGNHGPPAGSGNTDHGGGSGANGGHSGGPTVTPPAGACTSDDGGIDLTGPAGQAGASQVAHTNFSLVDANGAPLTTGPTARMMYFWYGATFDYVLNAHGLDAGSQWTLTYQPEPLPSSGVMCLGNATANGGGQLHLANSLDLKSNLPSGFDPSADPSTQGPDALLALVPSADVDCTGGTMTNFTPDKYLWSNPRVRYVDTNLLPPSP